MSLDRYYALYSEAAGYLVYDGKRGSENPIAACDDGDDADMIAKALNAQVAINSNSPTESVGE